ncbi:MAG: hypothetical protein ACFNYD_07425 [Bacteroides sp.]|jgi:hypothetical protein
MAELNSEELQQLQKQYENRPMSVADWVGSILLLLIPIANIVLLFVWAFGGNAPLSKRNWARAHLLILAVVFGLYIVIIVAALMAGLSSLW